MQNVTERELAERAVAPRVTLEALEENIASEVYFTARQGARAALLDGAIDDAVQPEAHEIARKLGSLHSSLGLLTICVLVLKNGFTVIGQSACASAENYQEDIGRRTARQDAVRQVWALMGYELRSKLDQLRQVQGSDSSLGEALTRMTAFGLGNKDVLRLTDVNTVLTHFLHDDGEEGGRTYADTTREAIETGTLRSSLPEAPPLQDIDFMGTNQEAHRNPVETNELGPRHPEIEPEPVVGSDAPEVKEH